MATGMRLVNFNWLKHCPVVHSVGLRRLPLLLLESSRYLESARHKGDKKIVNLGIY